MTFLTWLDGKLAPIKPYVLNKWVGGFAIGVGVCGLGPCAQERGYHALTSQVELRDINGDGMLDVVQRNYVFGDAVYVQQKGSDGKPSGIAKFDKRATRNLDDVVLPEAPARK